MNKLLLIDGTNILRRCYEANPTMDSVEKAESAASVALQSMKRGLREHRPSHCLVVFDAIGPNWRHVLYPEYKAHRKPMSPFLQDELLLMNDRMHESGWALMSQAGEEADDSIWGVAEAACAEGEEVVVLSTDKDLVRLVAIGAKVYNHFDKEWRDTAWCQAKFGVRPEQLTDYLALMGDSTDGIPGVESVGAKTAARLLVEHGTLEAILAAAAAGAVPGKVGERLVAQRELALLSQKLASLRSAFSPLDLWWDELEAPLFGSA